MITETQLREQIRDLCRNLGYKFYFAWMSIHSPRGMPDLILCRPPRLIFAELKTEKGQLSEYQKEWVELLGECGGNVECYVWRPGDIEEIARIMQGTDSKRKEKQYVE